MISFDEYLNEKKSPYKPETLKKYMTKWKNGEDIPFGIEASLKAQGLIPRADGLIKISPEYKKFNVFNKLTPITERPKLHGEKVDQKINREAEDNKKSKGDKLIKKHPDFNHDKNQKHDMDFEGNVKKTGKSKTLKTFKELKEKPKTKLKESTIPTFLDSTKNI